MKKFLFFLLFLLPFGVSACGMIGYIVRPSAEFLERTEDMDHTAILDLNDGIEDVWFNIMKPAGVADGGIITVTPVPAEAALVHVANVAKGEIPSYPYLQVTHKTLRGYVWKEIFDTLGFLIPFYLFAALLTIVICLIIMLIRRIQGRPMGSIKKVASAAVFLLFLLIFCWTLLGYSQQSLGLSGEIVSVSVPKVNMVPVNPEDKVTIAYSTTTKGMTLQVVSAENGTGLANYLERNGLPKSPANASNLSRYVDQGFNFVITYTPVALLSENDSRYVHVTFPSEKIFFPLAVNYDDNGAAHPVKVLVLKPVLITGYETYLSELPNSKTAHSEGLHLNNAITYYANYNATAPNASIVHFYREPKDYNHDVTMDIGTPTAITNYRLLTSGWILVPLLTACIFLIGYLYVFGLKVLPTNLRRIIILILYIPIGFSALYFFFFLLRIYKGMW